MRSKSVQDAGVIYLDHEQRDITTTQGNRWKVYGSPVRGSRILNIVNGLILSLRRLLLSTPKEPSSIRQRMKQ